MKPDQQSEILRRLRCAAGHLNAVIEMVVNEKPCEQVLHQLNAVQAALEAVGFRVFICQVKESEALILNSSSLNERADELKRLQSLYTIGRSRNAHAGLRTCPLEGHRDDVAGSARESAASIS